MKVRTTQVHVFPQLQFQHALFVFKLQLSRPGTRGNIKSEATSKYAHVKHTEADVHEECSTNRAECS